jgi:hypothetical protein
MEETERSVSMFRLFSKQMLVAGAVGTAVQIGMFSPASEGHFVLSEGRITSWSTGLAEAAQDMWGLSTPMIEELFRSGLSILHELLVKPNPTGFEKALIESITLYTRAALTTNLSDRLMHIFSALESFLLRDEQEPLQQNIADRVAYIVAETPQDRREIVGIYKAAYALRSKYVHHGRSIDEAKDLEKFFFHIWKFYLQLILSHGSFDSRAGLLNHIDNLKYS